MTRFDLVMLLLVCPLGLIMVGGQDEQPEPDDPEVQREMHMFFRTARTDCAREYLANPRISFALFVALSIRLAGAWALENQAKDNGDIYIINYDSFDGDLDDISTTTEAPRAADFVDFDEVSRLCNASFITPMSNTLLFNTTGKLLDEKDITSKCYFRCFFEKAGLLENFRFNVDLVRKYMWPATGDSIEYCESQGMNETNACIRSYSITQCAMMRALTDARNKPMV
ncbi:hypothetical protein KR222_009096 [Zaprionus bogoriensis]|nr:hypothetical protein KR222_009096 [Zaprionus bogoriensis]